MSRCHSLEQKTSVVLTHEGAGAFRRQAEAAPARGPAGAGAPSRRSVSAQPPQQQVVRPLFFQSWIERRQCGSRAHRQARISLMTSPCTSVNRRSLPLWRKVSLVWSMPSKCRMVACRS